MTITPRHILSQMRIERKGAVQAQASGNPWACASRLLAQPGD
jgi:hypothetical protein